MDLPVAPPVLPMLAKPAPATFFDKGEDVLFEPKWDGFRCLVFKDGDDIELGSRNTKPLTRYFPEVVEAMRAQLPHRCVLDGEIVVALADDDGRSRLEFEMLQQRIHPAASRITMLSQAVPASYVAFDLLAEGAEDLTGTPMRIRRQRLESMLAGIQAPLHLTRVTTDPAVAREWFTSFEGAGLDGVVAKPLDGIYAPNQRTMIKIKHARTADVVLAGMREHKASTPQRRLVGSLLLGLWATDGDGFPRLQHVGVAASFTEKRRAELWAELNGLETALADHPWGQWASTGSAGSAGWAVANPDRVPGTQSRWSQGKDLSFVPLRPERVLEVGYDHLEGRRFRHTAQFKRWRPDRDASSCDYRQLDEAGRYDLRDVWGSRETDV
ncbi:ATP-dependent DNA ligase [soil metagenome]